MVDLVGKYTANCGVDLSICMKVGWRLEGRRGKNIFSMEIKIECWNYKYKSPASTGLLAYAIF